MSINRDYCYYENCYLYHLLACHKKKTNEHNSQNSDNSKRNQCQKTQGSEGTGISKRSQERKRKVQPLTF